MPFHVTCVCGRRMVVPDDQAGVALPCSQCGRRLEMPSVQAAPTPPPSPPPGSPAPPPPPEESLPTIVVDTLVQPRTRGPIAGDRRRLRFVALALFLLAGSARSRYPWRSCSPGSSVRRGWNAGHQPCWSWGSWNCAMPSICCSCPTGVPSASCRSSRSASRPRTPRWPACACWPSRAIASWSAGA